MSDLVQRIAAATRTVNRGIGIACGVVLLATGVLILVEVGLRRTLGSLLGGTDEISGYVMAAITAWGMSWALSERAHVRIDLLQRRLAPRGRAALDVLALLGIAAIAALVTQHAWSVLSTSLDRGSLANTPLETPLWIPQAVWLAGWGWFALTAWLLAGCLIVALAQGRLELAESIAGAQAAEEAGE